MEAIKLDFVASVALLLVVIGLNGFVRRYHTDVNGYTKGNLKTKIIYDVGHVYLPFQ